MKIIKKTLYFMNICLKLMLKKKKQFNQFKFKKSRMKIQILNMKNKDNLNYLNKITYLLLMLNLILIF